MAAGNFADYNVLSLLNRSVECVVCNLHHYVDNLHTLPAHLKEKCLYLMSKRGLLTDSNIRKVLHTKVKSIDLSDCNVSNQTLSSLRLCTQLMKLNLNAAKQNRTAVTSEGIVCLAKACPFLEVVYLRRCVNITDEAIIGLSQRCKQLRELNIGGCYLLTDRSLAALGQYCCFLHCVNFSSTSVTDSGVIALVSGSCAPLLKEVIMNDCTQLTDEAVEAVIQFCPQISILLFHTCPKITDYSRRILEELGGRQDQMKQLTWTVY